VQRKNEQKPFVKFFRCILFVVAWGVIHSSGAHAQAATGAEMVNAPEFPAGLEWIGTAKPLTVKEQRGKVVLLDFWTYCCINCMHVIPDLKRLEAEFGDKLTVIGVHSAKFVNERQSSQIRQAVERYGIAHPVVNDSEFAIWESYAVRAWPTVIVISPEGKIAFERAGEGVYEAVRPVIGELLKIVKVSPGDKERVPAAVNGARSPAELRFPGKILADSQSERIFVADSGRNRIVITDTDGVIQDVIGSGEAGRSDGRFEGAQFNEPQGMALIGDQLFVADRQNHQIRQCDLRKRTVTTVAGDGKQGKACRGGTGSSASLNSPWDLVAVDTHLYIAMAGCHQIWKLDPQSGEASPFSGAGDETIRDGERSRAAHAQPSGITSDGKSLFVADSETSSIRAVSLTGGVTTLVGSGLFEFGDKDGKLSEAKLQHPLGVLWSGGKLLVADTYNSRVKEIDLTSNKIRALAGRGIHGLIDGPPNEAEMNEPSGLASLGGRLFVADTNNHRIRIIAGNHMSSLEIREQGATADGYRNIGEVRVNAASRLHLHFKTPPGFHFNDEGPNRVTNGSASYTGFQPKDGVIIPAFIDGSEIRAEIFFCEDSSKRCVFDRFSGRLRLAADAQSEATILLKAQ